MNAAQQPETALGQTIPEQPGRDLALADPSPLPPILTPGGELQTTDTAQVQSEIDEAYRDYLKTMMGLRMAGATAEQAERGCAGKLTVKEWAKLAGVSERKWYLMQNVHRYGDPELIEAAQTEKVKWTDAGKIADAKHEHQREAVRRKLAGEAKTLVKALESIYSEMPLEERMAPRLAAILKRHAQDFPFPMTMENMRRLRPEYLHKPGHFLELVATILDGYKEDKHTVYEAYDMLHFAFLDSEGGWS